MTKSEKIKELRKLLGLTGKEFALALGVSGASEVYRWEAGGTPSGAVMAIVDLAETIPAVRDALVARGRRAQL